MAAMYFAISGMAQCVPPKNTEGAACSSSDGLSGESCNSDDFSSVVRTAMARTGLGYS